jgi:hypothetical protein
METNVKVALDMDGTISEHPELFALLATSLRAAGHAVMILTYRDPDRVEATRRQLAGWGIEYDEVVFAPSLHGKGEMCRQHAVDVFIDQNECIVGVPEGVLVLKVRNGGNFDFEERKWLSTSKLTELLR